MKGGKILTAADVYFELKDRLINANAAGAEVFLTDLHRHGMLYARFVDPAREPDPASRLALAFATIGVDSGLPFAAKGFRRDGSGQINACPGRPNARRSRIFPHSAVGLRTAEQSIASDVSAGVRCGRRSLRWLCRPTAFRTRGKSVPERRGVQYGSDSSASVCNRQEKRRAFVSSLSGLRSRTGIRSLRAYRPQIEHVMPQTLTPEWELELGPQAREQWARLLHTLGNLTLTGYNADMSNRPYVDKRERSPEATSSSTATLPTPRHGRQTRLKNAGGHSASLRRRSGTT